MQGGYREEQKNQREKFVPLQSRKGIIESVNNSQRTANVRLVGSSQAIMTGVQLSNSITSDISPGDQCIITIFDETNPNDCIISSMYGTSTNGTVLDTIYENIVILTPTQVKALHTTPITLVATPISSAAMPSFIQIVSINLRVKWNTTGYAGSNNLEFRYTDGSGTKATADISSSILNTAGSDAYNTVCGIVSALVPTIGAKVVVAVPTADPTSGDSTVIFTVYYRIVPFA